jgi:MAP/microtubule affinity-regulating kinase
VKKNSGKALEQEIARYNAYKLEQDKRAQGTGAREAIAASSTANEDPNMPLVQYTMGEKIGAGAYACVRAAWVKESGDRVAVKVYEKSLLNRESRRRNVHREVHVLAKVTHRHIIGFREWFATDKHIYIVMENVCGGSLQSLLRKQPLSRFDDATAKRLFAQICEGLGYCHSLRVVHRDIKLDNVLLDRHGCVKIIDFGFAVAIPQGQKLKIFCGTPSYIAPEIISGQPYAFPGDVWALGVLLYVMLAGRFPFKASTQRELYRRIVRGSFQALENCVPEARELVDAVLQKNQDARPTVEQILTGSWICAQSSTSSCSSLGGPVGSSTTTATANSFAERGFAEPYKLY